MMKSFQKYLILLSGTLFIFCCASSPERFEPGYKPDYDFVKDLYNPKTVRTVTGTVTEVSGFDYEAGLKAVTLTLKSADEKYFEVSLGAAWYLEAKKVSYEVGDELTIEGSLVRLDAEEEVEEEEDDYENIERTDEYLLLARKITKDGKKLILRTKSGKPRWYRRGFSIGKRNNIGKRIDLGRKGIRPPM